MLLSLLVLPNACWAGHYSVTFSGGSGSWVRIAHGEAPVTTPIGQVNGIPTFDSGSADFFGTITFNYTETMHWTWVEDYPGELPVPKTAALSVYGYSDLSTTSSNIGQAGNGTVTVSTSGGGSGDSGTMNGAWTPPTTGCEPGVDDNDTGEYHLLKELTFQGNGSQAITYAGSLTTSTNTPVNNVYRGRLSFLRDDDVEYAPGDLPEHRIDISGPLILLARRSL
ncbi:MAG: hypothetical protein FJX77_10875 [Armatimonadetes bacterium]|nr:hypothetical protein [Armatimonadota bacterium]